MNFDVEVESIRAFVTALLVLYLWREGKREKLLQQKGWLAIITGFCLILFASLLDITDNFPSLNQYVITGKTHTESFLEKIVGYLGGFIVVFIGFIMWYPLVAKLGKTEDELRKRAAELESKVLLRTAELVKQNQILEQEKKLLADAEDQIRHLAYFDILTQLPNRRLLNDRMLHTMAICKRSNRYAALMFLDLDNFKPLNDTHGHAIGDLLLVEVANRLKSCIREVDTLARFGGDEYVVMLSELDMDEQASKAQALIVAEKIQNALSAPYKLTFRNHNEITTTVEHHCTASIGIILFIGREDNPDEVIKQADLAMYQAKNEGRNLIRIFEANH